jgi:putative nucleotidyltransferase with HDIG domain
MTLVEEAYSVKSILVSLIESIDLYNFLLKNHHRQTCIIAYQIGNHYNLDSTRLSNVVLASAIHDIGALHVTERDKLLYIDAIDPEPHQIMGERIIGDFAPFAHISHIIRHHHIVYQDILDGKVNRDDIPIECFIIHLADRIDVLYETHPGETDFIISEINKRFGTVFLPELQDTFNKLASTPEFWEKITDDSFYDLLLMSINDASCVIDDDSLESLAELFSRIVDFKSEWTMNHSKSVSVLADHIARLYGLDEKKCFSLRIAGYLHDIGKIAIPIEVLDKPGKLDTSEYKTIKMHATYSSLILSRIPALGDIAKWAMLHHEKHDKSGYPLGKGAVDFTIEMDILAFADIFAALAENRPYRAALTQEKILELLKSFTPDLLDVSVYDVIEKNMSFLYEVNASAGKISY